MMLLHLPSEIKVNVDAWGELLEEAEMFLLAHWATRMSRDCEFVVKLRFMKTSFAPGHALLAFRRNPSLPPSIHVEKMLTYQVFLTILTALQMRLSDRKCSQDLNTSIPKLPSMP